MTAFNGAAATPYTGFGCGFWGVSAHQSPLKKGPPGEELNLRSEPYERPACVRQPGGERATRTTAHSGFRSFRTEPRLGLLFLGLRTGAYYGRRRQALDIVLETADRPAALIAAVKSPKIYAELLAEWSPENLPSDQTIKAHLLRNKNFNPLAVDGFIKDFRLSISFSGLDKQSTIPSDSTETETHTSTMPEPAAQPQARPRTVDQDRHVGKQPIAPSVIGRITSPNCSLSVSAEGAVSRADLDRLIKLVELMLDSYPATQEKPSEPS